jgi:hypothetical protein
MGWQTDIFPLLIITTSGGYTGSFTYNPGPGAGNLIASDTAAPGTDPYGNAYLQGQVSYFNNGGVYTATQSAGTGIFFYTAPGYGGPWTLVGKIGTDGQRTLIGGIAVDGAWSDLTPGNGWFRGANGFMKYRQTIDNELQLTFQVVAPAAAVNGVTIAQVPAGIAPVNGGHGFAVGATAANTGTGPLFYVLASGAIQATGVGANAVVYGETRIPLDI